MSLGRLGLLRAWAATGRGLLRPIAARVTPEDQEAGANWLTILGAAALLVSLFLTWSHQVSGRAREVLRAAGALQGVPVTATAWQLYTMLDVVLAGLAVALIVVAVFGSHRVRLVGCWGAALGLAFSVHALAVPPTNGVLVAAPRVLGRYLATGASAGPGETLAIAGLVLALVGLALSLAADAREV